MIEPSFALLLIRAEFRAEYHGLITDVDDVSGIYLSVLLRMHTDKCVATEANWLSRHRIYKVNMPCKSPSYASAYHRQDLLERRPKSHHSLGRELVMRSVCHFGTQVKPNWSVGMQYVTIHVSLMLWQGVSRGHIMSHACLWTLSVRHKASVRP